MRLVLALDALPILRQAIGADIDVAAAAMLAELAGGVLTPYPAGWQALSILVGDAGEVPITSNGLTVVEFLIGVSRHRDLGIRLRTAQSLTGSASTDLNCTRFDLRPK